MMARDNTPKIVTIQEIDSALDARVTDEIMALPEPEGDDEYAVERQSEQLGGLVSHIRGKFQRTKDQRREAELRWLEAYRNYRGRYGPEVMFTDTEKSRAFVKVTKTKVNAAHAQITDVLFSGSKFPIGVNSTNNPKGIAEAVFFDPEDKTKQGKGEQEQPQSERSPLAARPELKELLGPLKEQLSRLDETNVELEEGYGTTPTSFTFEPAYVAAKNMEKKIHDQLEEAHASKALRSFAHELALFGTGVFKGPFHKTKEYPKWGEDGSYSPEHITIPDVKDVSIWDAYPDPDARNMEEAEYFIQRHRFSRTDLRALKRRPYFREESIELAIADGTNYINEYWEDHLDESNFEGPLQRWEVLEYWGIIDKEIAEEAGIEIPEEMEEFDQVQVNAWICGRFLLRLVLNPFTPARIPFYVVPYEINPYSIWGIGVAENMADTQAIMNGFMRMTVDNAALSGNVVFEVDENSLAPGQDMKIYPGKIFRRNAGAPGQSIFSTKFQNTTQENLAVFDKARQLADEATGLPSYSHGQANVQGVGKTASGMSMLMSAADKNIKAVVRNIDDYLLAPLGKAMFAFNMQFNFDDLEIIGDLEVVARGTESLMRNEIRSQKLMQFLQMTANPMDAPFVKRDYLLREISSAMDIDADKAINDPREAGIQAVLMRELQEKMGNGPEQAPQGGQAPGGPPAVSDPTQTGNGNIAPGAAPSPGEAGFTGTPGGAGGSPDQLQGGMSG